MFIRWKPLSRKGNATSTLFKQYYNIKNHLSKQGYLWMLRYHYIQTHTVIITHYEKHDNSIACHTFFKLESMKR